ncbi:MAG: glycosyltransferase family 39 protein [Acidimicrobiia bacterium]|nr:glycosyltransferase family 39 protein [Acidimicrobiia bacterium]
MSDQPVDFTADERNGGADHGEVAGHTTVLTRLRGSRPWWYVAGLALAAVVGAVIRVVNIVVVRPTCVEDLVATVEDPQQTYVHGEACDPGTFAIWGDSAYGYLQARLMARGHWFVDGATWFVTDGEELRPSAGDPPLYALTLSFFARLGLTSGTAMRLLSAAMGIIGVVLVAMLARRVGGYVAGVVAALIAAVYPMLWINDGMLLSESMFVPLVVAALLAVYRYWDEPTVRWAAIAGAATGLAALTRAEALLAVPFLLPALVGAVSGLRARALRVVVFGLAALAVCAPWFAYNMTRFEERVLMTAQSGAVLSAASCDSTFYGDRLGYWDDCMVWYIETGRVEDWPDRTVLDESQVDAVPLEAALTYTRENVRRLPVVVAARVGRMWDVYRPGESVQFNAVVEGRGQGPSQWGQWAYFALVPFALGGLVLLFRRGVPISPLVAVPAAVTVTAALTFGITRYRAPADAVLVVAAAVCVAWLLRRWTGPAPEPDVRTRGRPAAFALDPPDPDEDQR